MSGFQMAFENSGHVWISDPHCVSKFVKITGTSKIDKRLGKFSTRPTIQTRQSRLSLQKEKVERFRNAQVFQELEDS